MFPAGANSFLVELTPIQEGAIVLLFEKVSSNMRKMRRFRSSCTLRKHAYSNILKTSPPKTENIRIKN